MSARPHAPGTPVRARFKLDRFEFVGGERYEVEGRWSGVRGRLFIRPELMLTAGKRSQRLLADLDQKPWQATDGDLWSVAFPCPELEVDASKVELTVAPDITVVVQRGRAKPGTPSDTGSRSAAPVGSRPKPSATPGSGSGTASSKRRGLGVQLAEAQAELEQVRGERQRLTERLDVAISRAEQARTERERLTELRGRLANERDAALRDADEARSERDALIRDRDVVAADRDDAVVERDALKVQRDRVLTERDDAISGADGHLSRAETGREAAVAELARVKDELHRALDALKTTTAERDDAMRAGVEVERELHAARGEREVLLGKQNELIAQQNWLKGEVKRLAAQDSAPHRESAQVPLRTTASFSPLETPVSSLGGRRFSRSRGERRADLDQAPRTTALLVLAVAAIVVIVVAVLLFTSGG